MDDAENFLGVGMWRNQLFHVQILPRIYFTRIIFYYFKV